MTREEPIFNLKAVVQQTGLKPDTLRAWERRYGLPVPNRSSGRHRLYSQHDIDTIKWLSARQREGLSIKRAVELWRQIDADGHDPLQTATPLATQTASVSVSPAGGGTLDQLRNDWIDACLAYDEQKAEQLISQAFALFPPETVALEVLQKAIAHIGDGWYQGRITVQQEHFCSSMIIRRLEALIMAAPPPTRPGRILLACPPQEHHVIGPLLLTFLLRRRGWQVVYLGDNVPVEQLETTVTVIKPHLVIMAAQQLHSAATLTEIAHVLHEWDVPLAYGGLVFNLLPVLRERIAGHFLGEQIAAATQVVESLMTASRPVPLAEPVTEAYRQALDHFQERQSFIEAHVSEALSPPGRAHNHVALANRELGQDIGAALTLGDMNYLGTDINWIAGLLKNHQLPPESLHGYLNAYYQSALKQLDERGQPVIAWLGTLIKDYSAN